MEIFDIWEDKCVVAVYEKALRELEKIKRRDKQNFKRILGRLEMLAKRCFFNKEEQWKDLEGEDCKKHNIWELKTKYHRLAFFWSKYKNKNCFVIYAIWRKKGKSEDKKLIERICSEAQDVIKAWNKFREKGGKNA